MTYKTIQDLNDLQDRVECPLSLELVDAINKHLPNLRAGDPAEAMLAVNTLLMLAASIVAQSNPTDQLGHAILRGQVLGTLASKIDRFRAQVREEAQ